MTLKMALLVLAGSSIGGLCRVLVNQLLPASPDFPWATFLVNMAGCFLVGCCFPFFSNQMVKVLLVMGFAGGFTTFSGFGLELFQYLMASRIRLALWYAGLSLILGTVLVWIGYKTALWFR